jgi:hypothetical protein
MPEGLGEFECGERIEGAAMLRQISVHAAVLFIILAAALFVAMIAPISWSSASIFIYAFVIFLLYLGVTTLLNIRGTTN